MRHVISRSFKNFIPKPWMPVATQPFILEDSIQGMVQEMTLLKTEIQSTNSDVKAIKDTKLKNIQIALRDMKSLLKDLKVILTSTTQADKEVPSTDENSSDIPIKSDADMTRFVDLSKGDGIIQYKDVESRLEYLECKVGPIEIALTGLQDMSLHGDKMRRIEFALGFVQSEHILESNVFKSKSLFWVASSGSITERFDCLPLITRALLTFRRDTSMVLPTNVVYLRSDELKSWEQSRRLSLSPD